MTPLNVQNQHIAIAEREQSTTVVVLISGAFVWSRLIYERCLHLSDKFAYRSARLVPKATRNLQVIEQLPYAATLAHCTPRQVLFVLSHNHWVTR